MVYAGVALLYLAFGLTVYSLLAGIFAKKDGGNSQAFRARRSTTISVVAILAATLFLVQAFVANDFRFAYVARNSQRSLPLVFKISALWAGQSGSLLLWLLILSLLTLVVQANRNYQKDNLASSLVVVINVVRVLFLVLLLFVTSPFELLAEVPWDGNGLNPMLQSLGMVIHPPLLFLGFSGFLIPFALVVVELWRGNTSGTWLQRSRPWVLFSWAFLTAGIVTGGQWAYNELGWGGYWAWDPVENASLFPWLTSTALVHTLLLPKNRTRTQFWSFALIVVTFALTIFGTFLTRSGVLDSVHAFSGGILGQIFLGVLVVIVLFSLYLWWSRRHLFDGGEQEESFSSSKVMSKLVGIQLGNMMLLLLCIVVFLGTMFPLYSSIFLGREVVLDAEFYNQLTVPLFLVLLLLMGLAPVFDWHATDISKFWKRIWFPILVSLGVAWFTFLPLGRGVLTSLAFAIAAFGAITHIQDLISHCHKRKLGAYLVHLGVIVMLVGVTGSSVFVDDLFLAVQPGDKVHVGDYVLEYPGLKTRYGSDRYTVGTTLTILRSNKEIGVITSEKTFWENRRQPSTRVGIFSTFKEDLYLNLAGWENQVAQLHVQRFALVSWIWVGSILIYLGILVILIPSKILSVKSGR